jgi:hypothetical protein
VKIGGEIVGMCNIGLKVFPIFQTCLVLVILPLLVAVAGGVELDRNSSGQIRTVIVNAGDNVTLVCSGATAELSNDSIFWIHDTKDSERIVAGAGTEFRLKDRALNQTR